MIQRFQRFQTLRSGLAKQFINKSMKNMDRNKGLVLSALLSLPLFVALGSFAQSNHTDKRSSASNSQAPYEIATLAGGCFWCVESHLEKLKGVHKVISGYSGGPEQNPRYEEVASGKTGHIEVVQVHFDPSVVSYEEVLLEHWQNIDPTDPKGSFYDRGPQYRPAIFVHNSEQQAIAEASIKALEEAKIFPKPIQTEIIPFKAFWPAEDYHQDYYKHNPVRYKFYRYQSGRDRYTAKIWGSAKAKTYLRQFYLANQQQESTMDDSVSESNSPVYSKPDQATLKKILTPLQYEVTQEEGTERAFENKYWDEKRQGIYVDIVSGEPLFSSEHKYDSKTGWPSFYQTIQPENIVERKDNKLFYTRIEVRSKHGDSHLGHLFPDGPEPTGSRYCINSAALRFIPKEEMKAEGYEAFLPLFESE